VGWQKLVRSHDAAHHSRGTLVHNGSMFNVSHYGPRTVAPAETSLTCAPGVIR
jgi:hypothetical protein